MRHISSPVRWIGSTLAAGAAVALIGTLVVSVVMFDAWANMSDMLLLLGWAVAIGLGAALVLFIPLTLLGSTVQHPQRVWLPPLALLLVGVAAYLGKFGLHRHHSDMILEIILVWLSLLAGQILHSFLLLRKMPSARKAG